MNKRFFYWFIISIAAVQLFAVETVRFQEQTYSGSVTYNEKAQPGDAVFVRLSLKFADAVRKETLKNPAAVLQLFKGKERAATAQFFFTHPKNRSAETADMLAGIPLSTWLSGEETYSLKVIISTGNTQKKEITLPFSSKLYTAFTAYSLALLFLVAHNTRIRHFEIRNTCTLTHFIYISKNIR